MLFVGNMFPNDGVVTSYGLSNFHDFALDELHPLGHIFGSSIKDFKGILRIWILLDAWILIDGCGYIILLLGLVSILFLFSPRDFFVARFVFATLLAFVDRGDLALAALFLGVVVTLVLDFGVDRESS